MRVALCTAVLVALSGGCHDDATAPAPFDEQFDSFWSTFDEQYSYFAYKQVNWDSLGAVFRPRAVAASSQSAFIDVLAEMVAPLRDLHVHFVTPGGATRATYTPTTTINWDRQLWLRITNGCGWTQYRINLGYCRMDGIAYVAVGAWDNAQYSLGDVDAVLTALQDAPAMIIDVRVNPGGDDGLAFAFAGRFTSSTVTTGYTRLRAGPAHDDFGPESPRRLTRRGNAPFLKPVIVLSGRGAYSSNESFISAMRELPNVTILGDTSGGASAFPVSRSLSGGWRYTVSRWIEYTADRTIIEWNGIAPDVHVPWDAAAVTGNSDPILNAALVRLGAAPR
jgi:hypothetical protein